MTKIGRMGAVALALCCRRRCGQALAEKVLMRANDLSYGGKESIDPISPNRFYEVNDMIYSRLVRQDDKGEPVPELAVSWTPNADAKRVDDQVAAGCQIP